MPLWITIYRDPVGYNLETVWLEIGHIISIYKILAILLWIFIFLIPYLFEPSEVILNFVYVVLFIVAYDHF